VLHRGSGRIQCSAGISGPQTLGKLQLAFLQQAGRCQPLRGIPAAAAGCTICRGDSASAAAAAMERKPGTVTPGCSSCCPLPRLFSVCCMLAELLCRKFWCCNLITSDLVTEMTRGSKRHCPMNHGEFLISIICDELNMRRLRAPSEQDHACVQVGCEQSVLEIKRS